MKELNHLSSPRVGPLTRDSAALASSSAQGQTSAVEFYCRKIQLLTNGVL